VLASLTVKRIAALAVVLILTGCSTVESKDIRTSGMTAHLLVTLPENTEQADVTASLRVGTLTFVELGPNEQITASGGGQTTELDHHRAAGVTRYSNRLDAVVKAGTEITFTDLTLTRRVEGTLDKAFKDGSIAAESQSVRRVISAP
jgi:hypothetical protein